MPDAKEVELQGLGSKAGPVTITKTTPAAIVPVSLWGNVSDLAIHIGAQVALAAGTALVLQLQHQDWSSLGPYAAFAPIAVMLVAEGWNTFSGWLKAH